MQLFFDEKPRERCSVQTPWPDPNTYMCLAPALPQAWASSWLGTEDLGNDHLRPLFCPQPPSARLLGRSHAIHTPVRGIPALWVGDTWGPTRLHEGMGTAGRKWGPAGQEGCGNVPGLVLLWSIQAFLESQKIQPWLPNGVWMGNAGERPNPRHCEGKWSIHPIAHPLFFPMAGNDWE